MTKVVKVLVLDTNGLFLEKAKGVLMGFSPRSFDVKTEADPNKAVLVIQEYKPGIILLGDSFGGGAVEFISTVLSKKIKEYSLWGRFLTIMDWNPVVDVPLVCALSDLGVTGSVDRAIKDPDQFCKSILRVDKHAGECYTKRLG